MWASQCSTPVAWTFERRVGVTGGFAQAQALGSSPPPRTRHGTRVPSGASRAPREFRLPLRDFR
eukprot:10910408-Alexandrium_andersonii.AAC.1